MAEAATSFGDLLRQHRLAAGLTQASLAERSGLSVHGIQKLERGATHPYRDTTQRLSRALLLSGSDQARFTVAARPAPRQQTPNPSVPTATLNTSRHNLPIPTTTFVERPGEIECVVKRLREAHLLTITGSGGCGKTRLVLEVARKQVDEFVDGFWFVDLAPLADASLVAQRARAPLACPRSRAARPSTTDRPSS